MFHLGCSDAVILFFAVVLLFFSFGIAMICGVYCMYKAQIQPAAKERKKVIKELDSFSVHKTNSSWPADKTLVLGMIATMWRKDLNKDATDEECWKKFDEDVRNEVKPELERLLKQTESELLRGYLAQVLVTLGAFAPALIFIVLDAMRPVISPMLGEWAVTNLLTVVGIGFGVVCVTGCCLCCTCMMSTATWDD